MTIYNRVVKTRPQLLWHWGPRIHRYEAVFYNSAYGMGSVSAFTAKKCTERFQRMLGEFYSEPRP